MKKRIVVVEDHVSVREMLVFMLAREGTYEVIGEAGTAIEALRLCAAHRPDIVILDLGLPCISGVEALRRLRRDFPRTRVLVFSGAVNCALLREALREGPHGYVEKTQGWSVLREALAALAIGGSYFSPAAASILCELLGSAPESGELSARERQIIQMIGEGLSGKEIAAHLGIAAKTAENHRARLMAKLGIHDIAGLTREAIRRGLVATA